MTKRLIALSCASLLVVIQPQVHLAQSAAAQEKATTESDAAPGKSLLNQDVIAQEDTAITERNVAEGKQLPAQNKTAQNDWDVVKSITPGYEITVDTRAGMRFKGVMSSVTDSSVTINVNKKRINFDKSEIKKVYQHVEGKRSKSILKGVIIGAALAAASLGVSMVALDDVEGAELAQGIGFYALIGGGLGALYKGTKRVLIYETK